MTKIVSCMCVTVKVSYIFINKKSLMFKYGRTQKNSTPVSVWLLWCMPRLRVAWDSSHSHH